MKLSKQQIKANALGGKSMSRWDGRYEVQKKVSGHLKKTFQKLEMVTFVIQQIQVVQ